MEAVQVADGTEKEKWDAVTEYEVVERREDVHARPASFLRLWPKTGRKHQLRAHCAQILRAPITGDRKYGYVILGPMAGWFDPVANVPPTPTVITAPLPIYLQPMEPMLKKLDQKRAAETTDATTQKAAQETATA
ncbi:hypothetical protein SYNPS1DRAFT_24735 [Syncephalis pseudoplumigaleata]|uniref:21S rRNA pseudouridine(2819) synthase n=1 Tax=Syncephalis pseudoplumigaleata TaxID=1712513 RepID=A0A4P9YTK3_9FUNG|nr:hypothetical protein SYNPS1DRAFT_24735 [Syncephalis pseudoplumigaleata]|eukprot:RKP23256.1 hypothetical protein SYNPS1DRAFT_24735 [Syncephalis pseudoplumigaleata]